MKNVISFPGARSKKDMDWFINNVLNDPARLERVKAKRQAELEKARKEEEAKEIEKYRKQKMDEFVLKVAMAMCFCVTLISVLAALRVI